MNSNSDNLILVFTGPEITANVLKEELENVDIYSVLKSENKSALSAGFGATGMCDIFILEKDTEKAKPIIEEFTNRNAG